MSNTPLPSSFNPAGIELDRRQGLSRQLYQALRVRVLDGRLASGTRLPASRDLAAALSISRNSVVRAYDQLYAEGFIEGRVGDGTYVAQLPQAAVSVKKLSTKVSTGFSTGLPTGLSTNWLDLPVISSSKVIHSGALKRVEQRSTQRRPFVPASATTPGPAIPHQPARVGGRRFLGQQTSSGDAQSTPQVCAGRLVSDWPGTSPIDGSLRG